MRFYKKKKSYTVKEINELKCVSAKEIDLLSRVQHPNIIKAIDFSYQRDKRGYFKSVKITMPLAEKTLESVNLFKIPYVEKVRFIYEIASALYLLHEAGIVHCDIKANNILIFTTDDGEMHPVLADFGISNYSDTVFFLQFVMLKIMPPQKPYFTYMTKISIKAFTKRLTRLFQLTKKYRYKQFSMHNLAMCGRLDFLFITY
jgi:Serine/threonine protein kinase